MGVPLAAYWFNNKVGVDVEPNASDESVVLLVSFAVTDKTKSQVNVWVSVNSLTPAVSNKPVDVGNLTVISPLKFPTMGAKVILCPPWTESS